MGHLSLGTCPAIRYSKGRIRASSTSYDVSHIYRHSADAVLSLATNTTIVATVATHLADFGALWVQSPSGYDWLVANTLGLDWAIKNQPVLSRRADGHTTYVKHRFEEPEGEFVLCPNRCPHQVETNVHKNGVRVMCVNCNSRCTVTKIRLDRSTALGARSLIKGKFPRGQHSVPWNILPPPTQADAVEPEHHHPTTTDIPGSSMESTTGAERSSSASLRIRLPATTSSTVAQPTSTSSNKRQTRGSPRAAKSKRHKRR